MFFFPFLWRHHPVGHKTIHWEKYTYLLWLMRFIWLLLVKATKNFISLIKIEWLKLPICDVIVLLLLFWIRHCMRHLILRQKIANSHLTSCRTQQKYLIESKKLFVRNTFFDVKKCFVLMKQNLFDSNRISLDQINICLNQINFCLKSNKVYLWPYINAFISLFWIKLICFKKKLFGSKIFCLNQNNFISFKQFISLNQRNSFKQIIFFDSIKSFFSVKVRIRETDHFFLDFVEYWKQWLYFRVRINTEVFIKYFEKILTITKDINKRVFLTIFFKSV